MPFTCESNRRLKRRTKKSVLKNTRIHSARPQFRAACAMHDFQKQRRGIRIDEQALINPGITKI